MSHDIDRSTGLPAMAYVGEAPWHRLGHELLPGRPIEEWVKAARLDWKLERLPVQYLFGGALRTMDERFVLARTDTGEALSVVSEDYRVVQPREVLEFYRDLVEDQGCTLETAGALNGGRKIWALARTRSTAALERDKSDQLEAYILLATSCDKTLATTAAFTSVRVVCQNTLSFAMSDVAEHKRPKVKVTHSHFFDPTAVKKELGLDEAWKAFIRKANAMSARRLGSEEVAAFFDALLRQKPDKPLSPKAQREYATVCALLSSAPGQNVESAKGTLWGAVNAVSYYTDHVRASSSARLDSAWFGAGAALKNKAWAAADALIS